MKRSRVYRIALWLGLSSLGLAMVGTAAFAEVAVVTDAKGRYVRTLILEQSQGGRASIWQPIRTGIDPTTLLNPQGDRFGDSHPFLLEQPGSRQPWLVWSAGDGNDLEIAYATWSQGRWWGPHRLDPVDNSQDDLNPQLTFDTRGRPLVVWSRSGPVPRIYVSLYEAGIWSTPVAISDPSTPSLLPSVRVEGERAIVSYYTPAGNTVLFLSLADIASGSLEGSGPLDGPVPPPDAVDDPKDPGKSQFGVAADPTSPGRRPTGVE